MSWFKCCKHQYAVSSHGKVRLLGDLGEFIKYFTQVYLICTNCGKLKTKKFRRVLSQKELIAVIKAKGWESL